jgi:hypothetical protein
VFKVSGRKPEGRSPSLRTRSTRGGSFCHTSMCTERVHQPAGLDPATALSRDDLVVADPRTRSSLQHVGYSSSWNAGPGPARLLEVIAPAGFEEYFVELAEAGNPNRRQELAAKYEVTYSDEWVADLTSRYNLKLLGQ